MGGVKNAMRSLWLAAMPPLMLALSSVGAPPPDADKILAAKCGACHGGSERQGGLILEGKLSPGRWKSVLARVKGEGGKPTMPLGAPALSPSEISALEKSASAAKDTTHWAYRPVVRPLEPPVDASGIDSFILAKLEKEGLTFSPEADKTTLIRRVTLDLTGLPPTPEEVDAFVIDKSSNAYEKVVDRLLASQHFGEKLALPWLDAARYADSNGFQQDGDTYQWVWRDWIVNALNANMPFDQFAIEQLAGDLLPSPTLDQQIATGFNRNHLLNGEGGAIPEEQRNVLLFDRVDVTATTFLGLTVACAQCHDHKYDPVTQKDYYRFLAFFNNVPESGTPPGGGQYRIAPPFVTVETSTDRAKKISLDARLAAAQTELARIEASAAPASGRVTLSPWRFVGSFPSLTFDEAFATDKPLDALTGPERPDWADREAQTLPEGDNTAHYLVRTIVAERATTVPLSLGSDDAIKLWVNGALVLQNKTNRGVLPDQEKVGVALRAGANALVLKVVNGGGASGFYFRADSPAPPEVVTARERVAELTRQKADLAANLPKVMVMSDAQPRKTHVLERGNYETPRDEVAPGTPEFLTTAPGPTAAGGINPRFAGGEPDSPRYRGPGGNRLALARWLVSPENPLTARVQVNRYWQLLFGVGLAKTSENFGVQAEPPSHPELLDYLASEFQSDWNVKRFLKLLVMSRTYCQSSKVSPALLAKDPENRLLARGPRFRLPSLILRDIALASSGLWNDRIGGKPVYPYQPKGIWDSLAITKERDFTYPQSTGSDLYRRSLYTFWRRTVSPGNMFDASSRQACKVRASLTSTPLHALTTLNDPTWVEAGRALAQSVLRGPSPTPEARLSEAFRRVCARRPKPAELTILKRSLERALKTYRADPTLAKEYLSTGESKRDATLDPAEHAAYASVCLAIYNLDEALTKE